MTSMDNRLVIIFDSSVSPIKSGDFCAECESSSGLGPRVNQDHAFSELPSAVLEPVVCELPHVDRKGGHLACLDLPDGDPLAVDALYIDLPEAAVIVRPQHELLPQRDGPPQHHPREDQLAVLVQRLLNMKLSRVVLILLPLVGRIDRQQVQKAQEQVDPPP